MGQARTASGHEDYVRARRLAERGKGDAEAAEAKARSQTAQQEAREMQKSVNDLQANISPPPATMGGRITPERECPDRWALGKRSVRPVNVRGGVGPRDSINEGDDDE